MTTELQEETPGYKKSQQWTGFVIVGLICFTLILSVFTSVGKKNKTTEQALPAQTSANSSAAPTDESHLVADIEKENERKRLEQTRQAIKENQPSALDREGSENKAESSIESDIETKFNAAEVQRALAARVSQFNLTPAKETKPKGQMGLHPLDPGTIDDRRQTIANELSQVRQTINALQQGNRAPEDNGPPDRQNNTQAIPQHETIGRPAGESRLKPGQKMLSTGTVISAVLDQTLVSDYPGPFRALISQDVYDSTGNYILAPKGARVIGRAIKAGNVNEPIQARMGLAVRWIVLPNAKRISFERSTALDQAGTAAVKDDVNYHFFAQFMGVMAYAVLSSETPYEADSNGNDPTFEGNMSQSMRRQFSPLAAKYLNIVPTITLGIGTPLKIFLEDDIYAYPYESLGKKLYDANRTFRTLD